VSGSLAVGRSGDAASGMIRVALYARVSTEAQDPEVQLTALRHNAAGKSSRSSWIVGTRGPRTGGLRSTAS
jgi:hypothetical protein